MGHRPAILLLAGLLFAVASFVQSVEPTGSESPGRPTVLQVRLDNEAISPITARFLERAIQQAEREGAACVVIVLDTPGGLVDSTRSVVKSILRSEVPVVVFVAPSGARAASGGVFVTLASHIAAMAPGTNIGAAHPVQIGGLPISPSRPGEDDDGRAPSTSAAEEKSVNDTVAWARSLAELRGRNADWAARAVRESASASATEAMQEQAIDLLAQDMNDLLAKIDGREVTLPSGAVRLSTSGSAVKTVEMWWGEQLLAVLANPTLAFLLLILGFYGILFELYTPDWGVSGTLGAICLVLAFLGLAILPINYVGLIMIAAALVLFVAEAFVTSFGALTVGGMVCLILGGIMLVDSPAGFVGVSLRVLIPVAVGTGAITFFLVGSIVKAHRGRVQTGSEALVGAAAVAEEDFVADGAQYRGDVRAHGELWKAVSPMPVAAGQRLEIDKRQGLTLLLRPHETLPASEPTEKPTELHGAH